MSNAEMMSALKGHGRELRMSWPEDISTREVEYVLEVVALQMRTYRRIAELREAGVTTRGDLEWNSWFPAGCPALVALQNTSEGLYWQSATCGTGIAAGSAPAMRAS